MILRCSSEGRSSRMWECSGCGMTSEEALPRTVSERVFQFECRLVVILFSIRHLELGMLLVEIAIVFHVVFEGAILLGLESALGAQWCEVGVPKHLLTTKTLFMIVWMWIWSV